LPPPVHQTGANGAGRRGRGARVSSSLAEINVVPLVDVMLVLLVIFMVTAPMMQQGFNVNLPQARRTDPINTQPVYVTIPADFQQRRFVQIGEEPVRLEVLSERVRQAILPRQDKSLLIRMDASVSAQDIYTVIDELKRAGVEKVGLSAKPVEGRR
jgi:biopolymer transport protein TolR